MLICFNIYTMKYLKRFESIYKGDDIENDIADILSTLSDDGIVIDVEPKYNRGDMFKIEIYISKKDYLNRDTPGFKLIPYIDELKHLNGFLEDKGWVLNSDPSVSDREYGFDKWISNVEHSKNTYSSVPLFYVPSNWERPTSLLDHFQFEHFVTNYYDIRDIFLSVTDHGLKFHDVNKVHTGHLKQDMVDDVDDLNITESKPAISVTLKTIRESHENTLFDFSEEFYDDLTATIEHFESDYNCKLAHIYMRKNKSVWFKTIDAMKEYTSTLTKEAISWIWMIDVCFIIDIKE